MEKTVPQDIPSVNKILLELKNETQIHEAYLKKIIHKEIEFIRTDVKRGRLNKSQDELLIEIKDKVLIKSSSKLVNIINGTGIVLHGFGRAPLNQKA